MAEEVTKTKPKFEIQKILKIVFVVVNFVVVGGGAYLAYMGTLGHKSRTALEEELNRDMIEFRKILDEPPVIYSMDTFNTNLDGLPRRFVRIDMSVEMYNKEGFEELVTLGGESRDAITRILNSKKYEEIETVQGKLSLKNEVVAHLNGALAHGVVKNVYFTKFQVQ
jgi:flagellar basal body-associated protein FliL